MISTSLVVNSREWKPSLVQFNYLLQSLDEPEEILRISRFRFEIDRKRALIGRLLIRKVCIQSLCCANSVLKLGRSAKGRPIVLYPKPGSFDFNLSHHGSWVVIIADKYRKVGVHL